MSSQQTKSTMTVAALVAFLCAASAGAHKAQGHSEACQSYFTAEDPKRGVGVLNSTKKSAPLCRSCYPPIRTATELPTAAEATRILVLQQRHQADVRAACNMQCLAQLPAVSEALAGEYEAGTTSSAVLGWVAARDDARGVLEIGASYGGGSTSVLAAGVATRHQKLTSLEALDHKWLVGSRYYAPGGGGAGLDVNLLLGSSIGADELPRASEMAAQHDMRPAKWLEFERKIAGAHGEGVLASLLATGDFGFVFIDGGAFTGPAEWATIQAYAACFAGAPASQQLWVAMDDTHAKSTAILLAAHADKEKWEVVYEELNFFGLKTFQEAGYSFRGGHEVRQPREALGPLCVGWRRFAHSVWGEEASRVVRAAFDAAHQKSSEGTPEEKKRGLWVLQPRNFALLRLRR